MPYPDSPYAIIGAGGIGSHFCRILHRMLMHRQLGDHVTPQSFDIFDFDVVEWKNTKWQDYETDEVCNPKASIMAHRWRFNSTIKRFDEEDVANYGHYIIAADNPGVRKLIYEHADVTDKPFVDMRAEGDMYAVFTDHCELSELLNSLGEESESTEGRSCQRFADQERNVIMLGNWFAAIMGMDIFLRQRRGVNYPDKIIRAIV